MLRRVGHQSREPVIYIGSANSCGSVRIEVEPGGFIGGCVVTVFIKRRREIPPAVVKRRKRWQQCDI